MSLHLIYYTVNKENMQTNYHLLDDVNNELIELTEKEIISIVREKGTVYNVDWPNPHYISAKGNLGDKNSNNFIAVGNSDRYVKLYNPTAGIYYLDKKYIQVKHIRNRIKNLITNLEIGGYKDRYLRELPYKKDYNVVVKEESKSLNNKLGLLGITSYEFDYDCNAVVLDREKCTEITLPSFTKQIHAEQFSECRRLENILLGRELEEIGSYAFSNCRRLRDISLPDTVKNISIGAFQGCWELRGIRLPDDITEIQRSCFSMCSELKEVQLPKNLIKIEEEAFYECRSLEYIEIPPRVQSIASNAFYECVNIKRVKAPKHLKDIVYNTMAKDSNNIVRIDLY